MAASTSSRPVLTSSRSRRMASLSIGGRPLEAEKQVRAAGLKAGEIHGDVEVPELTEARDDRFSPSLLPLAPSLVEGDLEPSERTNSSAAPTRRKFSAVIRSPY